MPRISSHDWPTLFAQQEESGLSIADFCRKKGIKKGSFYVARSKLGQTHKPKPEKKVIRRRKKLLDPDDCKVVQIIQSEYRLRSNHGELMELEDHQRRIANEMFKQNAAGKLHYTTMVWSCIKKSGKTEMMAAFTYAFARIFGGEMYSIANDEEQAGARMFARVVEALKLIREHDEKLFRKIVANSDNNRIYDRIALNGVIEFADIGQLNPGPHTLRYIANDFAGEAGAMNAFVGFDELWAVSSERGERLWTEMQPIPNLAASIRLVTTYAGFYGESALLWRIYENVVKPDPHSGEEMGTRVEGLEDLPVFVSDDGHTIVYWDHDPRMPWHTEEFMEQARNDPSVQGRESEYNRLWRNEWSSGVEAFIDMEIVDRCIARGKEKGIINHMDSMRVADGKVVA